MDQKEIDEILTAAHEYSRALKLLEEEVKTAEQQIETSALETENSINVSFANLLESIKTTLETRRSYLLQQTTMVKNKSLKPLMACRKVILNKIQATEKLLTLTDKMSEQKQNCDSTEINKNASFLGSLPEVPELKEVPCISYQCESNLSNQLIETCSTFGSVSSIAPVQISSLVEKPGSILVGWQSIENEEKLVDIQEFRLQKAYGDVVTNKQTLLNFNDCYIGSDFQHLVKDLQPNQAYSFRVCCKYEGSFSWSSWSLPQVSKTTINSYSWRDNGDFNLRNEQKIAKPIVESPSILYSDGPQFHVGYSVEFTILECDTKLNNTYIGISLRNNVEVFDDIMSDSFFVEGNGDVFVNGVRKSTKLPKLIVGSKICFTCDLLNDTKILINIDCCDKRVTYDWLLSNDDVLYFFARFNSSRWKIMVE